MQLKKCSCGKVITTKNAVKIGRNELGLWLNCTCKSTVLLPNKKNELFKDSKEVSNDNSK